MPPECLNKGNYSAKAMDVWALGVSIYCFVFEELPFKGTNEDEIKQAICSQELQIPTKMACGEQCSNELTQLLCTMMDKDKDKRPTI